MYDLSITKSPDSEQLIISGIDVDNRFFCLQRSTCSGSRMPGQSWLTRVTDSAILSPYSSGWSRRVCHLVRGSIFSKKCASIEWLPSSPCRDSIARRRTIFPVALSNAEQTSSPEEYLRSPPPPPPLSASGGICVATPKSVDERTDVMQSYFFRVDDGSYGMLVPLAPEECKALAMALNRICIHPATKPLLSRKSIDWLKEVRTVARPEHTHTHTHTHMTARKKSKPPSTIAYAQSSRASNF